MWSGVSNSDSLGEFKKDDVKKILNADNKYEEYLKFSFFLKNFFFQINRTWGNRL